MTLFNINKIKHYYKYLPNIKTASFDYMGEKVYSATKVQRMYGYFVSKPVQADTGLATWEHLSWNGSKPAGTDIWFYLKSASTQEELDTAIWMGPYLNTVNDISAIKGTFLQFMIVLSMDEVGVDTPSLSEIKLSYFSYQNDAKFFTKTFDLGFVPKHVLLTYNGTVSQDSIVRFAITGFDSIDPNDYQYIDPNKIEELSQISVLSDKIKVMIEMTGETGVPVTIDEFALMFSGDQQIHPNQS